MIKFFRQIRKSLIEKNQMGKYFKYAVGEILLVVIGILIALQINNYNELRKNRNLESEYIERLLEDLKEDKAIIQAVLDYQLEVTFHAKKAITVFENLEEKNLNPIQKIINLYQASQIQDPSPASSTYKELIASGQINLIEDDFLKTAMIRYYEIDWTQTGVFKEPNNYRTNIRSKMPDYIQSEIRLKCGDIYVKIRRTMEISLPKTCNINISPEVAQSIINDLKTDETLKKDLRFLLGNQDAKIQHLTYTKEQLQELIKLFESSIN